MHRRRRPVQPPDRVQPSALIRQAAGRAARRCARALLEMIRAEGAAGPDGEIVLKMNSLGDPEMIDALYAASQAGTRIDLAVRGVCCLLPGVPGLSETIRVRSIVGSVPGALADLPVRDAARGRDYFIGSADIMPRNLDHRVEAVVPVRAASICSGVSTRSWTRCSLDDVLASELGPDGVWRRVPTAARDRRAGRADPTRDGARARGTVMSSWRRQRRRRHAPPRRARAIAGAPARLPGRGGHTGGRPPGPGRHASAAREPEGPSRGLRRGAGTATSDRARVDRRVARRGSGRRRVRRRARGRARGGRTIAFVTRAACSSRRCAVTAPRSLEGLVYGAASIHGSQPSSTSSQYLIDAPRVAGGRDRSRRS